MHKKRIIFGLALLLAACLLFWFFRPLPGYDTNRVEPRLIALKPPYQSVKTGYFWDGGSIGFEIIDCTGKREEFAIPSHLGDTNQYSKVFVGAMHDRRPGAVEVKDPEHTKRMLVHILASKKPRTPYDDLCLFSLQRRPVDFATCLFHKWQGRYAY